MAILAGVVVFAFLIGRVTAGGGGSSTDAAGLQTQINSLKSQNTQLQAALQASNAGTNTGTNGSTDVGGSTVPTSTVTASPSATTNSGTVGPNGTTYQVKAGDTLSSIEAKFYRATGQKYTLALEQANGMTSPNLRTGQTLTIPPASSISNTTATTPTATSPAATRPSPTKK